MKIKKMLLVVLVFGCVALLSTSASAELGWFTCTIDQAGPEGGTFKVVLTGTEIGGSGRTLSGDVFSPFFLLNKSEKQVMIATILTALANDKTVDVQVDDEIEPSLMAVYINP